MNDFFRTTPKIKREYWMRKLKRTNDVLAISSCGEETTQTVAGILAIFKQRCTTGRETDGG